VSPIAAFQLHRVFSRSTARARKRAGFTLIEMVFAITIGTMVMVAAGSLLVAIQRNERAIARRAEDAAALGRVRQVMQRTFSTVLMAPTPSGRGSSTAIATATTDAGTSPPDAGTQSAGDRNRSARILDEARANTPPRIALSRLPVVSGSASLREGLSPTSFGSGAFVSGSVSTATMQASRALGLPAGVPQRLELVLIDPPVPTQQRDVFETARVVRKVAQERLSRTELARQKQEQAGAAVATPVDVTASAEEEVEDPEGMNDVRAVRGAFELRPQPVPPELVQAGWTPSEEQPQLWELWWVPERARRSVQEMREVSRAARIVEEAAIGDPYRIASNIKNLRWRMFDDRVKRDEYVGVFRQDLPAYVELDVEMGSGMTAQWLFEVGLQTGPEVQQPRSTTAQGSGSQQSGSQVGSQPNAQNTNGANGSSQGTGTQRSTVPMTPMQPAKPARNERGKQ
jgi:prepilin-type N-terminal cleavage/methylation domain-containing protein